MSNKISPIVDYLKDWKNWVVHAIVGFGLLYIAFFLPVLWYYRVGVFVCVVSFNTMRMRHEKKKKKEQNLRI